MKTVTDSYGIKYKEINGTFFHVDTPSEVCDILNDALNSSRRMRLKLYYGDTKTGRDWHEENDTVGYVGRSTGSIKIPLLIHNSRSYGGGSILDHCILKIKNVRTGKILYCAKNYIPPGCENCFK